MPLSIAKVILLLTVYTVLALAVEQNCTCGLPGSVVRFRSCQKSTAEWRSHDHPDIGITGDCLTQFNVPVK